MTTAAHDGYRAFPGVLRDAADGIDALVAELGELTTAGRASRGGGINGLHLGDQQFGHDGLTTAFAGFCARWEYGVRALVADSAEMAEGLRESVRAYEGADRAAGLEFERLLHGVGDPRMSAEEFARQTPEQILAGQRPDWSSEAWSRAGDSMSATWSGVGDDLLGTAVERIGLALSGRNPYQDDIDELSEIVE